MLCARTLEWLTHAELPRELPTAPAEVAQHLRECAECQAVLAQLERAEQAWREQPLPSASGAARDRFLREQAATPALAASPRWAAWPRWIVAASLLVGLGIAVHFLSGPPAAHADSDVIDELIEWNLRLSESSTRDQRRDLFAGQVESLKAVTHRLSDDDRAFAESLIRNGEWLADNVEPLEEVDRFGKLADTVVERMNRAATRSDARATAKHARQFEFISTRAINPKLQRAQEAADEARRKKLERLEAREAKRREKLQKIHDDAPAAAKRAINKAMEQTRPKPPKKNAKKPIIV